jgi:hypothetical protein
MVSKDIIINKLIEFFNGKLTALSGDSQLVNVFVRPFVSRIINNNISKVDKALSLIANEEGMIDADGILNDIVDNLISSPVKEEHGMAIGNGAVEIKIPFMNKAICLDKEDIQEFRNVLKQYNV